MLKTMSLRRSNDSTVTLVSRKERGCLPGACEGKQRARRAFEYVPAPQIKRTEGFRFSFEQVSENLRNSANSNLRNYCVS